MQGKQFVWETYWLRFFRAVLDAACWLGTPSPHTKDRSLHHAWIQPLTSFFFSDFGRCQLCGLKSQKHQRHLRLIDSKPSHFVNFQLDLHQLNEDSAWLHTKQKVLRDIRNVRHHRFVPAPSQSLGPRNLPPVPMLYGAIFWCFDIITN